MKTSFSQRSVSFWCVMFGHRWEPLVATKLSLAVVCLRCRKNGWQI